MATTTTTKLSTTFVTADGTMTWSMNYADEEAEATDLQALGTAFVTNGSIFAKVPLSVKSMKFITTTETPITLP